MHVEPLPITGAMLLSLPVHPDDRGYFTEAYVAARYAAAGIGEAFVQDNLSFSRRNVLRGLHGDTRPASKLVSVLAGEAYDVVADLRPGSPTRGRWCGVTLKASEHRQLYVPAGCLHGFLALRDGVLLLYKQSLAYDPACEIAVRWDDPDFAVGWPLEGAAPILSERDARSAGAAALGLLRGDVP